MPDALLPDASSSDAPTDARYLVTARKYRPQTFGDLVAQEHVAGTLRNAITSGRLAHAYLFSGPRGVGKTTAARILAKAVNCETPLSERPNAEPCRTCASCRAFESGRSMNIIEIDAASNNRVEDIRELRDTVRVPPQGAKKKVYILDEVHMLSASAFNELLKTLEEPPPYALFIFATTEPHKVLPTILSRTQRFDFRRIAVPEIVGRLEAICAEENVQADEESLVLIARKGDGALRDALSLFDQAVSLCGTQLEAPALRDALGVVDTDLYFATTDRAHAGDRPGLLGLVDGLVTRGYDLNEFVLGLAEHIRNLLVARSTGTGDLIEGTLATKERYLSAAGPYSEADLLHLLMLTEETASALRESRQPRLTLELALLKMGSLEKAADLKQLLGHLKRLEAAVASGTLPNPSAETPDTPSPAPTPPTASSPSPEASSATPPTSPSDPASEGPVTPAPATPTPATPAPQTAEPKATYSSPAPPARDTPSVPPPTGPSRHAASPPPTGYASAPDELATEENPFPPQHAYDPTPEPEPDTPQPPPSDDSDGGIPTPSTPEPVAPTPAPALAQPRSVPSQRESLFGAPALRRSGGDGASGSNAALAIGDGTSEGSPQLADADLRFAAPVTDPLSGALADVRDAWPKLVDAVRVEGHVRLAAVIGSGTPHRVSRGSVEVAMPDDFSQRVATSEMATLTAILGRILGSEPPALRFTVAPKDVPETAREADPFERLKQLRQEHPTVRALFERFGAEIVW
ncbi:MAG: DNA polymerase III subunit gamma/tau [Bacteroidota bacterium]